MRNPRKKHGRKTKIEARRNAAEIIAFALVIAGLILWPAMIRFPVLKSDWRQFAYINYLLCAALVIFLMAGTKYTWIDLAAAVIWLLALIPLFYSNAHADRDLDVTKSIAAMCNNWLPVFLLLYKGRPERTKKVIAGFLVVFDVFIVGLAALAVAEKMLDGVILTRFVAWFTGHGYKCRDLKFLVEIIESSKRFSSVWGHPLTNSVLFNAFFILNDIYFRSIGKKYPRILFFLVAAVGVLLCASKTGIVVLGVYLVIANGTHILWFLVYAAAAAGMYALGIFDMVLQRFSEGSLTTGRLEALQIYFSGDLYPLRFWTGYGTGTTYIDEMYHLKAGFEFPPLMFSLDYGILFAIMVIGTIFVYYSYQQLKRRQIVSWIGFSLLFAQINTYNGIALKNQDVGWMLGVFSLIAINCAYIAEDRKKQTEIAESRTEEETENGIVSGGTF